jgi:hypothetical protein
VDSVNVARAGPAAKCRSDNRDQAAKKNSPHRFAINGNAIRACSLLYRNPKNDRRATMMTMAPTI